MKKCKQCHAEMQMLETIVELREKNRRVEALAQKLIHLAARKLPGNPEMLDAVREWNDLTLD